MALFCKKQTLAHYKGCLLLVCFVHLNLIVPWESVHVDSIKARGGLLFLMLSHPIQIKFSDDIDPQEMSKNLQLLRSRTLSRHWVDEIFSPFRILSPTHLCPL